MDTVHILRTSTMDMGTFGTLTTPSGMFLHTGELPWRDNQRGISCIPDGTYTCRWHDSPSKGWCYEILDVPGRQDCLIHSANWMGDASKGYKSELRGCIALGRDQGILENQQALISSRAAIDLFNDEMGQEDFRLVIAWDSGLP